MVSRDAAWLEKNDDISVEYLTQTRDEPLVEALLGLFWHHGIMTRTFSSSTAKIPFGLRDQRVIHIDELSPRERGLRCGCVCPECQTLLEARMGEKVRHYFAHSNSVRLCATGAETGIHLAGKQLIADRLAIPVPVLTANVEARDSRGHKLTASKKIYPGTHRHPVDHAVLEVGLGDIRPDLIVSLSGVEILIEVAVTHYIDEEKRRRLEDRGLRCIEISLGHVQHTLTLDVLEAEVFSQFNATWIVNPRLEEARPQLEARLVQQIAHANERNRRADEEVALERQRQQEAAKRAEEQWQAGVERRAAEQARREEQAYRKRQKAAETAQARWEAHRQAELEAEKTRREEAQRIWAREREAQNLGHLEEHARCLHAACHQLANQLAAPVSLPHCFSLPQLERHTRKAMLRMDIEVPPPALTRSIPGDWVFGIAPLEWKLGLFLDVIYTPQVLAGAEKWLSMADLMESARFLGLQEVASLFETRELLDRARYYQLHEELPEVAGLKTLPDARQAVAEFVGDLASFNMIKLVPGTTVEFTFRGLPPNRWAAYKA